MDESVDASPESEQLLSREHEELICSVDEFNHPLRDWKADDARATCLFANYRRLCINALVALDIKINGYRRSHGLRSNHADEAHA